MVSGLGSERDKPVTRVRLDLYVNFIALVGLRFDLFPQQLIGFDTFFLNLTSRLHLLQAVTANLIRQLVTATNL